MYYYYSLDFLDESLGHYRVPCYCKWREIERYSEKFLLLMQPCSEKGHCI